MWYNIYRKDGDNMTFDDLKIKNIDHTVRYTPDVMNFTAHNRQNHIIGLQITGSAAHFFDNKQFTLYPGSIYFFNQEEDYSVNILEKSVAFSVHFTTYEPIDTESFTLAVSDTDEIYRKLCKIEKQSLAGSEHHSLLSDFYGLCALFCTIRKRSYSPHDQRIVLIRDYIDGHFMESECLDHAADVCQITRRRFNDIFARHFNITPNRYIVTRKVEYAKKLLLSKELSVTAVAELCGFSDVYYFSKVFRKETGMTPTAWRDHSAAR